MSQIASHSSPARFFCPVEECEHDFEDKKELPTHVKFCHALKYTLSLGTTSSGSATLIRSTPTGKVGCPFESCEKTTRSIKFLERHLKEEHNINATLSWVVQGETLRRQLKRHSPYPLLHASPPASAPRFAASVAPTLPKDVAMSSISAPQGQRLASTMDDFALPETYPASTSVAPHGAQPITHPAPRLGPPALAGRPPGTYPTLQPSEAPPASPAMAPRSTKEDVHAFYRYICHNCSGCYFKLGVLRPTVHGCTHVDATDARLSTWRKEFGKRNLKLPAHTCFRCGIPNTDGSRLPGHPWNSSDCKPDLGYGDIHKNALYTIRFTPSVWAHVVEHYRCCNDNNCPCLFQEMSDNEYYDWIVQVKHSFYNGLELLLWLHHQQLPRA